MIKQRAEKRIGIVGAGIAGLHLGLLLRKHGISATITTDRSPDEVARMPLLNTVAHHSVTLGREDDLNVNHWTNPDFHYVCHHHYFGVPDPISFRGDFEKPSRAVDYRVYLPKLMEDFAARVAQLRFGRFEKRIFPRLPRASTCS
jgi:flavin-dependent dehydrogenase